MASPGSSADGSSADPTPASWTWTVEDDEPVDPPEPDPVSLDQTLASLSGALDERGAPAIDGTGDDPGTGDGGGDGSGEGDGSGDGNGNADPGLGGGEDPQLIDSPDLGSGRTLGARGGGCSGSGGDSAPVAPSTVGSLLLLLAWRRRR